MKKEFEPKKIKIILNELIEKSNLKKGILELKVREAWSKALGSNIDKYTSKITLKKASLYVTITSAPLKQELNYENKKVINLLNEHLGDNIISKIIIY
ncbi:MAG: DUF721 domain-containing protein [Flavobacteriaceae bacterium]|nr:DUF721 domain-containing protein [Flavobacteriaceae bacterium]|tara:strand:- start:585 stop:878 length:294 start_codon:yes stop_codon:yes gene_type:complete